MTQTEEKNLTEYAKHNNERIKSLIEDSIPNMLLLEAIMLEIADRTTDSDLEDACSKFYDEVLPVLRSVLND